MEGVVHSYRQSRSRQYNKHMIIGVKKVSDRESAMKLVGKIVTFTTQTGNKLTGKVASAHGSNGCVRVIFEKGLPGQSLGGKVEVA
jgi:large subunit ribosomal protein L35Ae